MRRHDAFAQIAAHPFLFLAAGTLGVGVHFLSFLVVQVTNSGALAGRVWRVGRAQIGALIVCQSPKSRLI